MVQSLKGANKNEIGKQNKVPKPKYDPNNLKKRGKVNPQSRKICLKGEKKTNLSNFTHKSNGDKKNPEKNLS